MGVKPFFSNDPVCHEGDETHGLSTFRLDVDEEGLFIEQATGSLPLTRSRRDDRDVVQDGAVFFLSVGPGGDVTRGHRNTTRKRTRLDMETRLPEADVDPHPQLIIVEVELLFDVREHEERGIRGKTPEA